MVLLENEAKELVSLHGVPIYVDHLVHSAKEAVEAAKRIEGDVAMKIVSPDILHKSDAGCVKLNIKTPKDIRQTFNKIVDNAKRYNPSATIKGVLVSPMVGEGLEVIVGTKSDDQFGPIIMFGIGGIMVEVLKDVVFRVLPISGRSARMMIDEIRSVALLNGFRGYPPADKIAIRRLLLAISEIIGSYPDIQEMDLNPVIVHEQGLSIVDARIILKKETDSSYW